MNGKEKCRMLREIRRQIALENDITLITEECSFRGECRGSCPRCEAELQWLEAQLEKRRSLGKRIAVAGVAAGIALGMTGCSLVEALLPGGGQTTGIVPAPTEEAVLMGEVPYEGEPEADAILPDGAEIPEDGGNG